MRSIAIDPSLAMAGYAETIGLLVPFELARIQSVQVRQAAAQGGLTPRQLRLVMDYMEDHIAKSISIAELAGTLGLSRFHFIRAFNKTAGVPPHRYFLTRRVERAKDLLQNSHLTVTEVSEMTGFGSTSQLTRAFRKVVGVNPSTFRRDML